MPTLLHRNTKKAQSFLWSYEHAKVERLDDVYKTCSQAKLDAEFRCKMDMRTECGRDFRIMSANTFYFTCGWINPDNTLRVVTPMHSYVIADKFAGIDK